jgi:hypothetical protein
MERFVSVANNNRHNQIKEKGLFMLAIITGTIQLKEKVCFFTNNNKHHQIKRERCEDVTQKAYVKEKVFKQ